MRRRAARDARLRDERDARLVAIGASAGGPAALATLLGALPKDFAAAIVIVQHVDRAFAEGMAQWLDAQSALPVRVAREGDTPVPGEVLLAATNDHLHFADATRLGYTAHPGATALPAFRRRVLPERGRALDRARDRRAADRHGPRRRDRPEGDAREGLSHDRAGRGDERGVRHAEGGGRAQRGRRRSCRCRASPRAIATAFD